MVNNFTEKSKRQMEDKQIKTAKGARAPRDIQEEYEGAFYRLPNGKYGMPAAGIKNAAVSACRFIEGVPMTKAKGSFFVKDIANGLVEIKGEPTMDERIVRVGTFGNKKPMTRYRPRFDEWSCTFDVIYTPNILSAEQLMNLFETAGFSVGLCEYRPEKSGNMGMFHVKRG